MRLVARAAEGTIDPHINYTLKNWQFYQFIYDGLVAFKKAAGSRGLQDRGRSGRGDARRRPNDGKT